MQFVETLKCESLCSHFNLVLLKFEMCVYEELEATRQDVYIVRLEYDNDFYANDIDLFCTRNEADAFHFFNIIKENHKDAIEYFNKF